MPEQSREELQNKLNWETARLPWKELQRHFARGVVVVVSPELDLVEVAVATAGDDSGLVGSWSERGLVRRASDDDARRWQESNPGLWAVVVAPWVLVQEPQTR